MEGDGILAKAAHKPSKERQNSSYDKKDLIRIVIMRTDTSDNDDERFVHDSKIPSNLSDDDAITFGLGMAFEWGWCPSDISLVIIRGTDIIYEGTFS